MCQIFVCSCYIIAVCDQSSFFKTACTHQTILTEKGNNTEWKCELRAPHNLEQIITVVRNKTIALSRYDTDGQSTLNDVCENFKEPHALFYVVSDFVHTCYSHYSVHIVVCSMQDSLAGDYSVEWGPNRAAEGSTVNVKLQGVSDQLKG